MKLAVTEKPVPGTASENRHPPLRTDPPYMKPYGYAFTVNCVYCGPRETVRKLPVVVPAGGGGTQHIVDAGNSDTKYSVPREAGGHYIPGFRTLCRETVRKLPVVIPAGGGDHNI